LAGTKPAALMKNANLGTALNSVVGAIGGGLSGQFISMLGMGGGVILAVIGIVKGDIAKKS
jgi:hypothetical protein